MKKMTFGALLILAMAVSVSASVITNPDASYLSNTAAVNLPLDNGALVTSIPVNSALTVNFSPTAFEWYTGGSLSGGPIFYAWGGSTLTINFSHPLSIFGFEAAPNDPSKDVTVDYFSTTGALLDTTTTNLTGYGFFGAEELSGIGSVTIHVANDNTLSVGDMQYALAPEPTTSLLLGAGLLGLGLVARRRRAQ